MREIPSIALADLGPPTRSITYGIVQPGKPADGGVPIVRVNNFRGHRLDLTERLCVALDVEAQYSRSRPRPNDILISLVGSIGQVAIAGPEISGWNLARAVGLIPTKDRHHALWIFYALQSPDAQRYIRQHANTTVQATFNLKDLTRFPIPYPEFQEREQIIRVLGSLDDKIELNRRMNETLEAMAQAIFRDWFVDFGPNRPSRAALRGQLLRALADGTPVLAVSETHNGVPDQVDLTCDIRLTGAGIDRLLIVDLLEAVYGSEAVIRHDSSIAKTDAGALTHDDLAIAIRPGRPILSSLDALVGLAALTREDKEDGNADKNAGSSRRLITQSPSERREQTSRDGGNSGDRTSSASTSSKGSATTGHDRSQPVPR